MRASSLLQQQPPTPPTVDQELQYNLHHLSQYEPEQSYVTSRPSSVYGSPLLHNSQYSPAPYQQQVDSPIAEIGLNFDAFGGYSNNPYPVTNAGLRQLPQYPQPPLHTSPPTPRSGNGSDIGTLADEYNLRNYRENSYARSISRTTSPQVEAETYRPKMQPRARKGKAAKADMTKTPRLTAPLSILTRILTDVPVKDMEAWVNRPAGERHREAAKRNGYVSRPMNCFMLYRSAYQERTKIWCLQNNHQVVSAVTGASWPLEPMELQDHYKELARIERNNHQLAFPNYKFSPSKAGSAPRKRKQGSFDAGETTFDGLSEFGDGSGGYRTPNLRRSVERSNTYSSTHSDLDSEHVYFPTTRNEALWEQANSKPLPNEVTSDQFNLGFPTTVDTNSPTLNMNNNHAQQMMHNAAYFAPVQSLLGLPGGQQHEFFQVNSRTGTPIPEQGHVDPMLTERSHTPFKHEYGYGETTEPAHPTFFHEHLQSPTQPHEPDYKWENSSNVASLEQDSEFNKWL